MIEKNTPTSISEVGSSIIYDLLKYIEQINKQEIICDYFLPDTPKFRDFVCEMYAWAFEMPAEDYIKSIYFIEPMIVNNKIVIKDFILIPYLRSILKK